MDKQIEFNFAKMLRTSLPKVGEIVKKQVKENLNTVSRGHTEVYKGKVRWVSKPGDPANNRSLDLTQSVRYIVQGSHLTVGEGDGRINYAKYLESPLKLNRPNVIPAIESVSEKIDSIFSAALAKAIRP